MIPVIKTNKELCPISSKMPQMQDKYFNLSPQYKQLPFKSTISAIAMWRSTLLEAILHNQVSARASEATRGSFCQILTLISWILILEIAWHYQRRVWPLFFVYSNDLPTWTFENRMKTWQYLCCILRIKCSLNWLVSSVDSHMSRHWPGFRRAWMGFPQ